MEQKSAPPKRNADAKTEREYTESQNAYANAEAAFLTEFSDPVLRAKKVQELLGDESLGLSNSLRLTIAVSRWAGL